MKKNDRIKHYALQLAKISYEQVNGPGCNPLIQRKARKYADLILKELLSRR